MDYFTVKLINHTADKSVVAVSDAVMVEGVVSAAGSNMLRGFKAPFDAGVVTKLRAAGIPIAGVTKTDEFDAEPVFGENPPVGALSAVLDGTVKSALLNDYSGKTLRMAPKGGACVIRPTYGTVSRYGLIQSVCSMDQIGVVSKNLKSGFETLSVIAGGDLGDGAMFPEKTYDYRPEPKAFKIGVPRNVLNQAADVEKLAVESFCAKFESVDVQLEYFDVFSQVMAILSAAELSNNTTRYDGVKFGFRAENFRGVNDLYLKTRTEGMGLHAKLWSMLGAYVLSSEQYHPLYEKAMRLRRLIAEAMPFDRCDLLALPVAINGDAYANSGLGALPALSGMPAVSLPFGESGVVLVGPVKSENALFAAGEAACQ